MKTQTYIKVSERRVWERAPSPHMKMTVHAAREMEARVGSHAAKVAPDVAVPPITCHG